MPKNIHIVALGSSFAAGPCIPNIIDEDAGRSDSNYAHQLFAKLKTNCRDAEVNLTDLTVSGATTLNVLEESQQAGRTTFPPQLESLPSDATIVTFTCGGNDIRYIGSLIHDSTYPEGTYVTGLGTPSAPAVNRWILADRIRRTLDRIHSIAPDAKVYLVEYLPIIAEYTKYDEKTIPLRSKKLWHYREVARTIAGAYSSAIREREEWAEVVGVSYLARDHALGSQEPWVFGLKAAEPYAPYHPNLRGHTAIAEILYRKVLENWKETRR